LWYLDFKKTYKVLYNYKEKRINLSIDTQYMGERYYKKILIITY